MGMSDIGQTSSAMVQSMVLEFSMMYLSTSLMGQPLSASTCAWRSLIMLSMCSYSARSTSIILPDFSKPERDRPLVIPVHDRPDLILSM